MVMRFLYLPEAAVFLIWFYPEGYDWKSLKQDSLVVDVGGGVGSSVLELKGAFPHLRFVVQDRPKVVDDGVKVHLKSSDNRLAVIS
jgi:O-methyltransferase domain